MQPGRWMAMAAVALLASTLAGCTEEDSPTGTTHTGTVVLPQAATTALTVTARGADVAVTDGAFTVTGEAGSSPWLVLAENDGVPVGLTLVRPTSPTTEVSCRETARAFIAIRSGLYTLPQPFFEVALAALDDVDALTDLATALCAALEVDAGALTRDDPTLEAAVASAVEAAMVALDPRMQAPPPLQALVHITWPGDEDKTQWIEKVYADDAGDTTFPAADNHVFFRVRNTARRYVGVTVETRPPGGDWAYVDNGSDDHTVEPGPAPASIEGVAAALSGIAQYLWGDRNAVESTIYQERVYAVPAPVASLEPGESLQVRFKLMGLSLGATTPLTWLAEGSVTLPEPEYTVMYEAVTRTLSLIPLRQLLKLYSGGDEAFASATAADTFPADLWDLLQQSPQLWDKLEKRDFGGLVKELVKYAASAESARWFFGEGMQSLFAELDALSNVAGPYVLAPNVASALVDLYESPWIETWTATITRPQITRMTPYGDVESGDVVTVTGVGFDDQRPADTLVYVSQAGQPIPTATLRVPAASVTVNSDKELTFLLPAGWGPGPVQVCVDGLCSNDYEFPGAAPPWVEILEVRDHWGINQLFEGVATLTDFEPTSPDTNDGVIVMKLHDPPDTWPARPAVALALWQTKWMSDLTEVTTETFELPIGVFSWMEADETFTYWIEVVFDCDSPPTGSPSTLCRGPGAGSSPTASYAPSVRIKRAPDAP